MMHGNILMMTVLAFTACTSRSVVARQDKPVVTWEAEAAQRNMTECQVSYNDSRSHIVCFQQRKVSAIQPKNGLRFFVFDQTAGKVLLEEILVDGSVRWRSDRIVEFHQKTGIISDAHPSHDVGFLFNIDSLKKYSIEQETN